MVSKKVIEFLVCGKKGKVLRLGHSCAGAVISVPAIFNREVGKPSFSASIVSFYQFYVEYFVHELSCRLLLLADYLCSDQTSVNNFLRRKSRRVKRHWYLSAVSYQILSLPVSSSSGRYVFNMILQSTTIETMVFFFEFLYRGCIHVCRLNAGILYGKKRSCILMYMLNFL
jgi:hypothetical protein